MTGMFWQGHESEPLSAQAYLIETLQGQFMSRTTRFAIFFN